MIQNAEISKLYLLIFCLTEIIFSLHRHQRPLNVIYCRSVSNEETQINLTEGVVYIFQWIDCRIYTLINVIVARRNKHDA